MICIAALYAAQHLIPKFGAVAPQEWTSSTVLNLANTFYVNSFIDMNLYHIMC